mgnify:CR=1 FL=1
MPEKEFTKEELQIVIKQYGEAAKRCQKAGIDIIEIHAGIGYMVMRFISKYSNHRTDEYGGDTKGRCKLLTDIIDEIHKQCGEDYPILVRYSADDLMPGGQRVEDLKEVIEVVEAHGIDAWSIQAGFHEAPRPVANQLVPEGEFIYLSKEAKKYTSLPCFPGTRINHLDVCEKILADGSGDAAGMARHWIAEPEIGIKVPRVAPRKFAPASFALAAWTTSSSASPASAPLTPTYTSLSSASPKTTRYPAQRQRRRSSSLVLAPPAWKLLATSRCAASRTLPLLTRRRRLAAS